jgi:hypothetical protein
MLKLTNQARLTYEISMITDTLVLAISALPHAIAETTPSGFKSTVQKSGEVTLRYVRRDGQR